MATLENPFEKVHRKMVAARLEFMSELAKFSLAELGQVPTSSDWSALTLAHHLYIADGLVLEQLRQIQDGDNPLLTDLAEETPNQTRSTEPPATLDAILAGMAARREEIFEYLN